VLVRVVEHLQEAEAFVVYRLAAGADGYVLSEDYGVDVGAVDVGYHRVHMLPVHLVAAHGGEIMGLAGVVEREVYGIVDMSEHIDVVEAQLQRGAVAGGGGGRL